MIKNKLVPYLFIYITLILITSVTFGCSPLTATKTIFTTSTTTTSAITTTTAASKTSTTTTQTATTTKVVRVVSLTTKVVNANDSTCLEVAIEKDNDYAAEQPFRLVLKQGTEVIYDNQPYAEAYNWAGNVGTFDIPMTVSATTPVNWLHKYINANPGTYTLSVYDDSGNDVYENQYTFSGQKLVIDHAPTAYWFDPINGKRSMGGVDLSVTNTGDLPAYIDTMVVSVMGSTSTTATISPGYGSFYIGKLSTKTISGVTVMNPPGQFYSALLVLPGKSFFFCAPVTTDSLIPGQYESRIEIAGAFVENGQGTVRNLATWQGPAIVPQ